LLIIVGLGYYFLEPKAKQTASTNPAVQTSAAPVACAANDSACFQTNFSTCAPATMTTNLGDQIYYKYEITGKTNDKCVVQTEFIKNPNPDYLGLSMNCALDSSQNFEDQLVDPSGKCSGTLYDKMFAGAFQPNQACTLKFPGTTTFNGKESGTSWITSMSMASHVTVAVNVIGFKGSASQVSWVASDPSVSKLHANTGSSVDVEAVNPGASTVTITDNAVGPDCKAVINWQTIQ